jgi:hypothetical protein
MGDTDSAMRSQYPVYVWPERAATRVGIEAAVRLQTIRSSSIRIRHRRGQLPCLRKFADRPMQEHNNICSAGNQPCHELASPLGFPTDDIADQDQQAT